MTEVSVLDLVDEFMCDLECTIQTLVRVRPEDIGLDRRCDGVWIDVDNDLIISNTTRLLNYYGGFEYIDDEYVLNIGNYTIYSEHERVIDCINRYKQKISETEEG